MSWARTSTSCASTPFPPGTGSGSPRSGPPGARWNPQGRWYDIALHGDEPDRHHAAARAFAGNFLFSTGPNTQGGGTRATQGHYDVPMRDCTVMLDGEVIVERGRIVDKRMLVPRVPR